MKVLADFHHHALAESLALLFEDRFGWELYFPTGMDWYESGVWQFEKAFHGDRVARQYLEGIWAGAANRGDDIWIRKDPRYPGRLQRGIAYNDALDTKWDIVLSTLPPNDPGLAHIARECGARFGVQVGNNHQQSAWHLADFILSSSTLPQEGYVHPDTWGRVVPFEGKPTIIYHQEFDLWMFRDEYPPADIGVVASFVNCFPEGPSYPAFLHFAREHPDIIFKVYGAAGQPSWSEARPYADEFTRAGGDLGPVPDVADAMRAASVIWHSKHWSDGFGHVIHNAFAVGRPVIGYEGYYRDKLAGPLWQEGVTTFDIERLDDAGLARVLRDLLDSDTGLAETMGRAAARRFRDLVDFDAEAAAIRTLLDR